MKQIGNLSVVCAKNYNVLCQIINGQVNVYIGEGPNRKTLSAKWDDDKKISEIISVLNFGEFCEENFIKGVTKQ